MFKIIYGLNDNVGWTHTCSYMYSSDKSDVVHVSRPIVWIACFSSRPNNRRLNALRSVNVQNYCAIRKQAMICVVFSFWLNYCYFQTRLPASPSGSWHAAYYDFVLHLSYDTYLLIRIRKCRTVVGYCVIRSYEWCKFLLRHRKSLSLEELTRTPSFDEILHLVTIGLVHH